MGYFMADNRTPTPDKDPNGGGSNPWMKSLFIWAGILLALILFVQVVDGGGRAERRVSRAPTSQTWSTKPPSLPLERASASSQ
jgi:hypothetical protein